MNCDGVSNLLSAYLDGELSPGELLRVEEHLRRCHACADEVDSLRQTIALVSSLEEVEVPANFGFQLHQRLVAVGPPVAAVRRTPAAPSWQRNVRRWAVPAAAAAAALAIGLTTFDQVVDKLPGGLASQSNYN
ncbi:MAG TPA: zf-HC2 domain-containing protein, partial [Symbiobacteriaceae bacterium]|nr:zf-HC2 domain-containing protein [Symbiobacteriaceae bacterium]